MGRERRESSCSGPFSRITDTWRESRGRGVVSSITGMGVKEADEQVKVSGSCEDCVSPSSLGSPSSRVGSTEVNFDRT